ncbi:mitochondrial import inner membrane translocase subunit Tim10B [Phlebotomus papatasi]|uniref:mitochondrial import inner membrane translocase subunit Tim10B n=1 Tax=Phlebotomus papatasi TaxID=29031 RepID=UPI002483DBFF|nr:mitochondrial import inner membrane translocase subunit Tim10B [Phlebotomus papatasi]
MNIDSAVSQIRNFKDFLQLYNKLTEHCFTKCVDNFHSRTISAIENQCVNNCFGKFTNVNQKILGVYIDVQQEINTRRIAELEANQATAIQETAPTAPAVTEAAINA